MKILIAPDKFKGSLSAREAARIIGDTLRSISHTLTHRRCPVADGGDGTLDVLAETLALESLEALVLDPLGRPRNASFGYLRYRSLAVVEMALASGLQLVPPVRRNPLQTSTYGTGELTLEAVQSGAREILIALGGSATVDGGLGFLQALGARFTVDQDLPVPAGGGCLSRIREADLSEPRRRLARTKLTGLTDVSLPLLGPQGARLFMGQKGAGPDAIEELEAGLSSFAKVLSRECGRELSDLPGTGAAGGLGLALLALGGTLENGFGRIAELTDLGVRMKECDVVLTGEGSLDEGSRAGKAPVGVGRMAKELGKPCLAVCGSADLALPWLAEAGLTEVIPLFEHPLPAGDPRLSETRTRLKEAVTILAARWNSALYD